MGEARRGEANDAMGDEDAIDRAIERSVGGGARERTRETGRAMNATTCDARDACDGGETDARVMTVDARDRGDDATRGGGGVDVGGGARGERAGARG